MEIAFGQAVPKAALVKLFEDFLNFLNLGKTMNGNQVVQTVELILDKYAHLNLLDFKLFFKKLKLGDYGKFYDRVDGSVVLDNLMHYSEDKLSQIRFNNDNSHAKNKKQEKVTIFHPDVVEALKKAVGEKDYSKTFIPAEEKPKTQSEILIQSWTKQFDNIYSKYGVFKGIRYIKINDQLFTFEKFIERKFENYESR